jgi:Bacterial surface proteins containing Ig-like domains
MITLIPSQTVSAASDPFPFIILSQSEGTLKVGDEFYILAITSNGKQPTWKSSNSKIAAVNTYGIVTAKKAGSALITAKIKNAEASCYITVAKTEITISTDAASLERSETIKLSAKASSSSAITWKSSKKSIATVDEFGLVTGIKPGKTTITANADGSSAACTILVKSPTVKLDKTSISLYKGKNAKLMATVSSNVIPVWKSNKKSVAIVDASGTVTAIKNGSATITATVDGVSAECEVIISKPDITLSISEITLKKGESTSITASVSSGNLPAWTTSNLNIISITSKGEITALQKGKAYVYATEDGTKARCIVHVTE